MHCHAGEWRPSSPSSANARIFWTALDDVAECLAWTTAEYNEACMHNPAEVERRLREAP